MPRKTTCYPVGMNTTILPEAGPVQPEKSETSLVPGRGNSLGRWRLIVGPRSLNSALLAAIARMGLGGPVRVLDGGNRFNAYIVARAVAGRTEVLSRITVSRAFTCYQVLSLLESTPAIQATAIMDELAPPRLVALDLLNTFYDESVRLVERKRLLQACLRQLARLAGNASAISVHPPALPSQAAVDLLEMLKASPVVETYFAQPALPPPELWRLF